ncbi:hypothetical protein CUU66_16320 [Peribacillus deserti]|uniref:Uncharacterized protein n=1 Tax=Peribacillus deserti TaxID=673318 RepID=A0A2N5M3H1_9BACI|nr:hypothetical protein CUU66_16320 [Peribacillus deserti]
MAGAIPKVQRADSGWAKWVHTQKNIGFPIKNGPFLRYAVVGRYLTFTKSSGKHGEHKQQLY